MKNFFDTKEFHLPAVIILTSETKMKSLPLGAAI